MYSLWFSRKARPAMTRLPLALGALALTALPVLVQAGSLKQLTLAQDLYAYGLAAEDPVLILSAAKIANAVHIKEVDRATETRPTDTPGTDDSAPALPGMVSAADMFELAYELASGDDDLQMRIEDAAAEGSRGQVGGATRSLNRLQSGYVDMVRVDYEGGKLAELAILGNDGANLDLRVTDAKGNTICAEQGTSDKLYCAWTPATDGSFFAEIENVSPKRNSYYVLTN